MLKRPDPSEHDAYYGLYIDQAPDGDILAVLVDELTTTLALLRGVSARQETHRYAEGKWSIRELVGHLVDTEWTFTYRGLCFARTDPAARPGFDQDLWARVSNAGDLPLPQLCAMFEASRRAGLAMFHSLTDAAWARSGVANDCSFTVRSIPYILAGHEIHHRKVLEEKYL